MSRPGILSQLREVYRSWMGRAAWTEEFNLSPDGYPGPSVDDHEFKMLVQAGSYLDAFRQSPWRVGQEPFPGWFVNMIKAQRLARRHYVLRIDFDRKGPPIAF